jgi:predicted ribosome quality control (RQC) complex YloA/Tae2 family protein
LNEFFYARTSTESLGKEKGQLLSALKKKRNQAQAYIDKCREKLSGLDSRESFSQRGDLIMANMQNIPVGASKVVLTNFYNDNTPIEIKLNPELTPQKNAEVYYRKSRNQQIEVKKLEESIAAKAGEVTSLDQQIHEASATEDLSTVRRLAGAHQKVVAEKAVSLPYREYTFKGFVIRVGRNAEANDELTLKYAHKDDLWLHAKDVSGSHVVIVHHPGYPFPKDVITYAAQLAAYHSKRRTESLCPVAYTLKKYVRKRKGDPAGAVVVEREEVVMVDAIVPSV